jgi:DNA-directed RNA polymerase subunit RPC12/RpoP
MVVEHRNSRSNGKSRVMSDKRNTLIDIPHSNQCSLCQSTNGKRMLHKRTAEYRTVDFAIRKSQGIGFPVGWSRTTLGLKYELVRLLETHICDSCASSYIRERNGEFFRWGIIWAVIFLLAVGFLAIQLTIDTESWYVLLAIPVCLISGFCACVGFYTVCFPRTDEWDRGLHNKALRLILPGGPNYPLNGRIEEKTQVIGCIFHIPIDFDSTDKQLWPTHLLHVHDVFAATESVTGWWSLLVIWEHETPLTTFKATYVYSPSDVKDVGASLDEKHIRPKSDGTSTSPSMTYRCSTCGEQFPVDQVCDDQGQIICQDCYSQVTGADESTYTCSICGKTFSVDAVLDVAGQYVCKTCYSPTDQSSPPSCVS